MAIGINTDGIGEDHEEPSFVNKVAPSHHRTSCSDEHPINGSYSEEDMGGCRRCDLLAMERVGLENEQNRIRDKHVALFTYYGLPRSATADDLIECMGKQIRRFIKEKRK